MGKKAPKLCKVQMEFSPIHDITPGLNSQGNNRAPVYNISTETDPNMVKLPFVPEKTRAEINAAELLEDASAAGRALLDVASETIKNVDLSEIQKTNKYIEDVIENDRLNNEYWEAEARKSRNEQALRDALPVLNDALSPVTPRTPAGSGAGLTPGNLRREGIFGSSRRRPL